VLKEPFSSRIASLLLITLSERNRQHAKRSRQRKRQFLDSLEESVHEIRTENERLFEVLGLYAPEDRRAVAQREEELARAADECFIAALQQPQSRILGDDALVALRELFQ
jgi:bZIP transcription factor